MAQTLEQRLAGMQTKDAVQDERLDQHERMLKALGADVRWTKKVLYVAVGALLGVAPAPTANAIARFLGV